MLVNAKALGPQEVAGELELVAVACCDMGEPGGNARARAQKKIKAAHVTMLTMLSAT